MYEKGNIYYNLKNPKFKNTMILDILIKLNTQTNIKAPTQIDSANLVHENLMKNTLPQTRIRAGKVIDRACGFFVRKAYRKCTLKFFKNVNIRSGKLLVVFITLIQLRLYRTQNRC